MKKLSVITLLLACLLMVPALFLPLWDIFLDAPQYPEGLHMEIWLSKLGGDVSTISGLNHYIGMKEISEEMFPEFSFMRQLVIGVIVSGVLVALLKKRPVYFIWFVLFLGIAAVGIYDFWQWEYDYGHNLSPTAAIKIPGMTYQPPLIGCKQLLNFNACSFPATGGLLIMSAGTLCFLVFLYEILYNKSGKVSVATRPQAASVN